MVISMMVNSCMVKCMERVFSNQVKEILMRVSGSKIKEKVMEFIKLNLEKYMKDNFTII